MSLQMMLPQVIQPAFDSWQAFWQMGHHGPYIWAAWGISLLMILGLWWWMRQLDQTLIRQARQQQRRQQAGLSQHNAIASREESS